MVAVRLDDLQVVERQHTSRNVEEMRRTLRCSTSDEPQRRSAVWLVVGLSAAVVLAGSCTGGNGATTGDLHGRDANGNGVRDDVEAYVATFPVAMQENLMAVAANEQAALLVDSDTAGAARRAHEVATEAHRLVTCIPVGVDADKLRDAQEQVRHRVTNTDARRQAVADFVRLLGGQSFPTPDCTNTAPSTTVPVS